MMRIADIIGLIVTGILGLLWMDIRKVGRSRQEEKVERLERAALCKEQMFDTFLTKQSHNEQCAKNLARIETSILTTKMEILKEIRNGKKK